MDVLNSINGVDKLPFLEWTLNQFVEVIEQRFTKTIKSIELINMNPFLANAGYYLTNRANGIYYFTGITTGINNLFFDYGLPSQLAFANLGVNSNGGAFINNLYQTASAPRIGNWNIYIIDFN